MKLGRLIVVAVVVIIASWLIWFNADVRRGRWGTMTNEMTLTDGEMKAESEDIELYLHSWEWQILCDMLEGGTP